MKLYILLLLILCVTLLNGVNIFVINSYSQTLSKIDTQTNEVNNTFSQLGLAPNHMVIKEHFGYVVNSGANSVQKVDLTTGQTEANIFIADSSNPYDIAIKDDFAYVTGLFTNKIYKVSLNSNQVVDELSVGMGPEGMCIVGNTLYVANTGNYPNYSPSTVSVIDLNDFSIVTTIPVETNPQFIAYADGKVHVVCTGNWSTIQGKVCVIDPSTNTVERTLTIGGNLGNIWISNDHKAYIAEAMNTGVYVYDTQTYELEHTFTNPLTPGGSCLSGNTDYLVIVDSQWGQNGIVKLMNWNNEVVQQYTVGLSPTDIQFFDATTSVTDETASPSIKLSSYPNPFASEVHFSLELSGRSVTSEQIQIFNLRGQLIQKLTSDVWNGKDMSGKPCPNGVYLYKYLSHDKALASGKITLFR